MTDIHKAFLQLHLSVILAGATGVLGKLCSQNSYVLTIYRSLIAFIILFLILHFCKTLVKVNKRKITRLFIYGFVLGAHWICFYGSIKVSNVSIGVVCLSSMGFFTALMEPLLLKTKLRVIDLALSIISIAGILLIFHFDSSFRLGIAIGLLGSFLASIYTILNKKMTSSIDISNLLMYEMIGVFIFAILVLPFYMFFYEDAIASFTMNLKDFLVIFTLSSICTVGLYLLEINAVKYVSAFSVNLTFNLEPVYSIILAFILFAENKELQGSFYLGVLLIIISVVLQNIYAIKKAR